MPICGKKSNRRLTDELSTKAATARAVRHVDTLSQSHARVLLAGIFGLMLVSLSGATIGMLFAML